MRNDFEIAALAEEILALKQSAQRLLRLGEAVPAVRCNTARILASVKMLELNICDAADLGRDEQAP